MQFFESHPLRHLHTITTASCSKKQLAVFASMKVWRCAAKLGAGQRPSVLHNYAVAARIFGLIQSRVGFFKNISKQCLFCE